MGQHTCETRHIYLSLLVVACAVIENVSIPPTNQSLHPPPSAREVVPSPPTPILHSRPQFHADQPHSSFKMVLSSKIEVRTSAIAGRGLYAKEPLSVGEMVCC
jgi:hypothetical protein